MSRCERFMISSSAGQVLDARLWMPQGSPRAVVQIVHDVAEYIGRYDELARALNAAGIAVAGHTQLGHGAKAPVKGHLAEKDGWRCLVEDVRRLRGVIREQCPGVPCFLLGQGMGATVVRCCLAQQGCDVQGAILLGAGESEHRKIRAGLALAHMLCLFGGRAKPSETLDEMFFGPCRKAIDPARTAFDWLSRDGAQVDRYLADEYCGLMLTAGGWRDVLRGAGRAQDPQTLLRTPKGLPLLFLSGEADPLCDRGQRTERLAQAYRAAGVTHTETRLYPDCRHDLLHEADRTRVFRDVIIFVDEHCS